MKIAGYGDDRHLRARPNEIARPLDGDREEGIEAAATRTAPGMWLEPALKVG